MPIELKQRFINIGIRKAVRIGCLLNIFTRRGDIYRYAWVAGLGWQLKTAELRTM